MQAFCALYEIPRNHFEAINLPYEITPSQNSVHFYYNQIDADNKDAISFGQYEPDLHETA